MSLSLLIAGLVVALGRRGPLPDQQPTPHAAHHNQPEKAWMHAASGAPVSNHRAGPASASMAARPRAASGSGPAGTRDGLPNRAPSAPPQTAHKSHRTEVAATLCNRDATECAEAWWPIAQKPVPVKSDQVLGLLYQRLRPETRLTSGELGGPCLLACLDPLTLPARLRCHHGK